MCKSIAEAERRYRRFGFNGRRRRGKRSHELAQARVLLLHHEEHPEREPQPVVPSSTYIGRESHPERVKRIKRDAQHARTWREQQALTFAAV